MLQRLSQILAGFRWAAKFDNPLEILVTKHLLRRKSPLALVHQGMQLFIDLRTSDGHVVGDVLLEGMYDRHLNEVGKGRKPFRYLNLGANIGTFDLRVFQIFGSQCSGVAVEMNPATFARLVMHLEDNRLLSRVRAINAAVWDAPGEAQVEIEERDTGQTCRSPGGTGTRGHGDMGSEHQEWPVPLVPWRDVFALASQGGMVDLVKVDIEGAEEQVIPCITPDEAARMRFLVVETHGPSARQVVTGHLQALNFTRLSEEPGTGTTHLAFWKAPG